METNKPIIAKSVAPIQGKGARPTQQINNPVKPPLWKSHTLQIHNDVVLALDSFCEVNGFTKRDTVDVALRDYLKLPEPEEQ